MFFQIFLSFNTSTSGIMHKQIEEQPIQYLQIPKPKLQPMLASPDPKGEVLLRKNGGFTTPHRGSQGQTTEASNQDYQNERSKSNTFELFDFEDDDSDQHFNSQDDFDQNFHANEELCSDFTLKIDLQMASLYEKPIS